MNPGAKSSDSLDPAAPHRVLVIDSDLDAQFRLYPFLKEHGIEDVFGPGTKINEIVEYIRTHLKR